MTVIGTTPHPRVLAVGLTEEEVALIEPLCGEVRLLGDGEQYHAEEYDAVISFGEQLFDRTSISFRLIFDNPIPAERPRFASSSGIIRGGDRPYTRATVRWDPAREKRITDLARSAELERLVLKSVVPANGAPYSIIPQRTHPEREVHPLAVEQLHWAGALAAFVTGDSDVLIWLPAIARPHLKAWLIEAFTVWRRVEPDLFPKAEGWADDSDWSSPAELVAAAALATHDAAESERRAESDRQRIELVQRLADNQAEGAAWRALLTEDGNELVEAVGAALKDFGFDVIDADALDVNRSAKREDIRLVDGPWTGLVEVKGYEKDAKTNDLGQGARAAVSFAAQEQRAPDALWHVVNANRRLAPLQRRQIFRNVPEQVEAFAEDHAGLIIDTRELFRLRLQVAQGVRTPEVVREYLKNSTGIFVLPDEAGSGAKLAAGS